MWYLAIQLCVVCKGGCGLLGMHILVAGSSSMAVPGNRYNIPVAISALPFCEELVFPIRPAPGFDRPFVYVGRHRHPRWLHCT